MLELSGCQIKTVAIVDDDPDSRSKAIRAAYCFDGKHAFR